MLLLQDDTSVDSVIPPKTDPPRLIGIGDIKEDVTLFSFVDGVANFTEKCPIKTGLKLIATYWVFNIEFISEFRPAFLLIATALLKDEMARACASDSNAGHCLLKQLDL